jgi:thiamine-monophosphate kinase
MAAMEFEHIAWLRGHTPDGDDVIVGPGDDTSVVRTAAGKHLVTTDMLLDGSCFLLAEAGAYRVGRKAMNVNLSDIAAMAGVPRWAVVSVGLPREAGAEVARELHRGLCDAARIFGVALIGGDTNSWDGRLAISVTLIGEAMGGEPVLRSGARVGDGIYVTGPLGGSLLGHHLDFAPKVRIAQELHRRGPLHAMIDISDGLAKDLHHICEESHVGAVLFADRIPVSDAAVEMASRDGQTPLQHALSDGEDFELVFTADPKVGARLMREIPGLHAIGTILESGYFLEVDGVRQILEPRGYEHAF